MYPWYRGPKGGKPPTTGSKRVRVENRWVHREEVRKGINTTQEAQQQHLQHLRKHEYEQQE